jgi:hypothetical protein
MTAISYAVVQSGVVINTIIADSSFVAPTGAILVPSSTAQIGWTYNGSTFSPPAPSSLTEAQLLAYAQQKLNTISAGGLTVNVAASVQPSESASVSTTTDGRADILGLMVEISQGATSITWYQSSGNLTLTVAQVNIIAAAVAALRSSAYATWSAIVTAINAGTITTTAQIDTPPAPIPAWPLNS